MKDIDWEDISSMPKRDVEAAEYLGDGVYIKRSFSDPRIIVLLTDSHEENDSRNIVVIEPEVLSNLVRWLKRMEYVYDMTTEKGEKR